jgi:hypothetical protein
MTSANTRLHGKIVTVEDDPIANAIISNDCSQITVKSKWQITTTRVT